MQSMWPLDSNEGTFVGTPLVSGVVIAKTGLTHTDDSKGKDREGEGAFALGATLGFDVVQTTRDVLDVGGGKNSKCNRALRAREQGPIIRQSPPSPRELR